MCQPEFVVFILAFGISDHSHTKPQNVQNQQLSTHNDRYVKCALYIYGSSPIMGGKIRSYCLVRGETLI